MMTSRTSPAIIELRRRFEDGTKLLTEFNPDTQVIYCRDKEKCFFGKAPSIGLVENAYGRKTATSWLEIQLNNLSEFAGCKGKLSPAQIAETAAMILDGYPHYKLTEFMLFFQRFKRCEYGKFYGAVDPMVILQALATFDEERRKVIADRKNREQQVKQDESENEHRRLRQRYAERIPAAFTPEAPISFLQYRLMGYDSMTDEQLTKEIVALRSGEKSIPADAQQILDTVKRAFRVDEIE